VSANFIWINVISTVCNVLGNIKQTGKSSEDIGVGYFLFAIFSQTAYSYVFTDLAELAYAYT